MAAFDAPQAGTLPGFAVMGGVFGEGIDPPVTAWWQPRAVRGEDEILCLARQFWEE
jgi:hypothetical protein